MAVPRHDRRRLFALAVALLLVAGCAVPTPYQPAVKGYGYSEQQLESNRYRVTFSGNSVTPRDTVQNYLLHRAAEVTLESGHDYFTVVDQDLERSTIYHGSGFNDFAWGPGRHSRRAFGLGVGNYTAYPIDSYTAFADIVMADGEKPAGESSAYDARDVLRQLGPTIKRPDDDDA
ncbi:MAG TPA: hypothetical protein VLE23_00470 [Geminicoccaceae bacterium]|nr:hypothetical protein [Geminicoccaceae bacterium]